jgi:TP901 family phage tail tape measure protein
MVDATIDAVVKIAAVDISEIKKSLEQLRVSIDQGPILTELRTLRAVFEKPIRVTILTNIDQVKKEIKGFAEAAGKPIVQKVQAVPTGAAGGITNIPAPGIGNVNRDLATFERAFAKAKIAQQELKSASKDTRQAQIDSTEAVIRSLRSSRGQIEDEKLKSRLKKQELALEIAIVRAREKQTQQALKDAEAVDRINQKRARLAVPTLGQLERAGAEPTGFEQAIFQLDKIRGLQGQLNKFKTIAAQTNQEVGSLGKSALVSAHAIGGNLAQSIAAAGGITQHFGQTVAVATLRLAAFSIANKVIFGLQQAFRGAIRDVVKFESQLASANKIFRESRDVINEFGRDQVRLAVAFGQTIQSVQEVGSEFARQGLSVEQTLRATEGALLLVNAAGVSTVEAMELLTVVVNTFGGTFEDSTRVADLFVSVADSTASSVQDLIQGFSRAAATAEAAGFSQEDLAATIGVVREATRRSATSLGTSFKSIIQFIIENRKELEKLGISVENQDGSLRGLADILVDLQDAFSGLTEEQKIQTAANIVEKRRVNELLSAISRADKIQRIAAQAANSFGLAQAKAGIELDTTASKLKSLESAFVGFIQEVGQAGLLDIFKDLVSSLTIGIDLSRELFAVLNKFAGLGSIITVTTSSFLIFGKLVPFIIQMVAGMKKFVASMQSASVVIENLAITESTIVVRLQQQIELEKIKLQTILATNTALTGQLAAIDKNAAAQIAANKAALVKLTESKLPKEGLGFGKFLLGSGGVILLGTAFDTLGEKIDKTNGKVSALGNTISALGTGLQAGGVAAIFGAPLPLIAALTVIGTSIALITKAVEQIPSLEDQLQANAVNLQNVISQIETIRTAEDEIAKSAISTSRQRTELAGSLQKAGSDNISLINKIIRGEASINELQKERASLQVKTNKAITVQLDLLNRQLISGAAAPSRPSDSAIGRHFQLLLEGIKEPQKILEGLQAVNRESGIIKVDLGIEPDKGLLNQLRALEEEGQVDPGSLEKIQRLQQQINGILEAQIKLKFAESNIDVTNLNATERNLLLEQRRKDAINSVTSATITELFHNNKITEEQAKQLLIVRTLTGEEFDRALAVADVDENVKSLLRRRAAEATIVAEQAIQQEKVAAAIVISQQVLKSFETTLESIQKNQAIAQLDISLDALRKKELPQLIDLAQAKKNIDFVANLEQAERRLADNRKGQEKGQESILTLVRKLGDETLTVEKITATITDDTKSTEEIMRELGISVSETGEDQKNLAQTIEKTKTLLQENKTITRELVNLTKQQVIQEQEVLKAAQDKFAIDSQNRAISTEIAEIQEQIRKVRFDESQLGDKFGERARILSQERLELEEKLLRKKQEGQFVELGIQEEKAQRELEAAIKDIEDLISSSTFELQLGEDGLDKTSVKVSNFRDSVKEIIGEASSSATIDFSSLANSVSFFEKQVKEIGNDEIDLNLEAAIASVKALSISAQKSALDIKNLENQIETEKQLLDIEINSQQVEAVQERLTENAKEFLKNIKSAFSTVEKASIKGVTVKLSLQELRRGGVQLAQDQLTVAKEEARIREESARRQLEAAEQLRGRASPEFIEAERELIQIRIEGIDQVTEAQIEAAKNQIEAAKSAGESFLNLNREQRQAFIRNIAIAQSLFGGVQSAEEAARRAADIIRTPGGTDALRKALEGLKAVRGTGRQIGGIDVDIISEQIRLAADGGIKVEESLAEQQFALDEERNALLKELIGKTLGPSFENQPIVDSITALSNDLRANIATIQGGGAPEIIRRIADREVTRAGVDTTPIEKERETTAIDSARNILGAERQLAEERSRLVNQIGTSFNEAVATRPTGAAGIGIDGAAIQSAADTFSNIIQERLNTVFATIAEQLNLNMGEGTATRLAQFGIKLDEFSNKLNSSLVDRTAEMQVALETPVNLKLDEQAQELKDKGISGNITLRSEIADVIVRVEATELVANLTNAIQEFVSKEQLNAILTAIDRSLDGRLLTRGINIETGLG